MEIDQFKYHKYHTTPGFLDGTVEHQYLFKFLPTHFLHPEFFE